MEIKRKEGESANSLIYRFIKKTQQSGILREIRRRRFRRRAENRRTVRLSALHRQKKKEEFEHAKKMGIT